MSGVRRLRLVHTSDVHLGAYRADNGDYHRRRRDEVHATFARVIDLAIEEQADLVLIAGDFFDNHRAGTDVIQFAIEQLARLPVPAVILPGNHDPVGPGSIYERVDFEAETGNARVIGSNEGETLVFDDLGLALWGRADNAQRRAFRPLEAPPSCGREPWQIAMGHGHYVPPGERSDRSYLIYAEEVEACGRQYVALGHWDHFLPLRHGPVTACYSGAPDPPVAHTQQLSGVVALVTLDSESGVTVEPRAVSNGDGR